MLLPQVSRLLFLCMAVVRVGKTARKWASKRKSRSSGGGTTIVVKGTGAARKKPRAKKWMKALRKKVSRLTMRPNESVNVLKGALNHFHATDANAGRPAITTDNDPGSITIPSIQRWSVTTLTDRDIYLVVMYTPSQCRGFWCESGTKTCQALVTAPNSIASSNPMSIRPGRITCSIRCVTQLTNVSSYIRVINTPQALNFREARDGLAAMTKTTSGRATTPTDYLAWFNAGNTPPTGTLFLLPYTLDQLQATPFYATHYAAYRALYPLIPGAVAPIIAGFGNTTNAWDMTGPVAAYAATLNNDPSVTTITNRDLLSTREWSLIPISREGYCRYDNFNSTDANSQWTVSTVTNELQLDHTLQAGADKAAMTTLIYQFPKAASAATVQTYDISIRSHDVCRYPIQSTLGTLMRKSPAMDPKFFNAMTAKMNEYMQVGIPYDATYTYFQGLPEYIVKSKGGTVTP